MNYLAHGFRFLDDPIFLVGTAVPDWLRVAERRIRVRAGIVRQFLETAKDDRIRRLCRGILQHHADDDAFHTCTAFHDASQYLTSRFRELMPDPFDHRPGFLGHVLTEMLLDDAIALKRPELPDLYYRALQSVPVQWIQDSVGQIAGRPVARLAEFAELFCRVRFLYDYADNPRLLMRMNQVMRRAQLSALDETVLPIVDQARQQIQGRMGELLAAVENSRAAVPI